jgi:hypothetical protein
MLLRWVRLLINSSKNLADGTSTFGSMTLRTAPTEIRQLAEDFNLFGGIVREAINRSSADVD